MANPIENIQNRAAHAQASANDSLLVGNVVDGSVRAAQRSIGGVLTFDGVLCDVLVTNRRSITTSSRTELEHYTVPRVRSAVPVRGGHEVFLSITDGDPRRGAWVISHTSIPRTVVANITDGSIDLDNVILTPTASMPASISDPSRLNLGDILDMRGGNYYQPGRTVFDYTSGDLMGNPRALIDSESFPVTSKYMSFEFNFRFHVGTYVHSYKLSKTTGSVTETYSPLSSITDTVFLTPYLYFSSGGTPTRVASLQDTVRLSGSSINGETYSGRYKPGIELFRAGTYWTFSGAFVFDFIVPDARIGSEYTLGVERYHVFPVFTAGTARGTLDVGIEVGTDSFEQFNVDIVETSYPSGVQHGR